MANSKKCVTRPLPLPLPPHPPPHGVTRRQHATPHYGIAIRVILVKNEGERGGGGYTPKEILHTYCKIDLKILKGGKILLKIGCSIIDISIQGG